jgi:hypothetical protein
VYNQTNNRSSMQEIKLLQQSTKTKTRNSPISTEVPSVVTEIKFEGPLFENLTSIFKSGPRLQPSNTVNVYHKLVVVDVCSLIMTFPAIEAVLKVAGEIKTK